jgi:hypothetical protein
MTTWRIPVAIDVQPWFADHCFDGKVVLPAVETMAMLATEVAGNHPEIDVRVMNNVRFARFLEIPVGSSSVAALIECRQHENGSIHAKLLSRRPGKTMTRLQEHGEVLFSPAGENQTPVFEFDREPQTAPAMMIPAEQVYRKLVPFGPGYHTLQGDLHLGDKVAWGRLQAPVVAISDRVQELVGSPFPLDGAFHAACVLGQRTVDFVPFPVGFDRRIILNPTQSGGSYHAKVKLLSQTRDELLFDLHIFDDQGQVFEQVTGLRMRDVSGGKIKPPEWMKRQVEGDQW